MTSQTTSFVRTFKNLTVFVFVFVVLLFVKSGSAHAFSGAGAGTSNNPYRVTTCLQLQEMNDDLAAWYSQVNDIDCSDSLSWEPIGSSSTRFTGSFDGRNYTISNLYVNKDGDHNGNGGLFDYTDHAGIYNVKLTNANITYTSGEYQGSLIGHMEYGQVLHSSVQGNLTGTGAVGGLIGSVLGGNIEAVSFTGNVINPGGWTGGLIAFLGNASLADSYVNGNILSGNSGAGLVASVYSDGAYTSVTNSYTTGTYQDGNYRSALIGFSNTYSGTQRVILWNLFTTMMPTGDGTNPSGSALLARDDAASGSYPAWILGDVFDATVVGTTTNCVGGALPSGCSYVNDDANDSDHFKNTSTAYPLNNWDFADAWQTNSGYPTLRDATPDPLHDPAGFAGGDGSAENPYQIEDCEQLQAIDGVSDTSGKYFVLNNDIDCSGTNPSSDSYDSNGLWGDGEGFLPIGITSGDFEGNFNGNDHTISGLYINRPLNGTVGLFYQTYQATISHVTLSDETIIADGYCGGLTGGAADGSNISYVTVTADITCSYTAGGIIGGIEASNSSGVEVEHVTATPTFSSSDGDSAESWGGIIGSTGIYNTYLYLSYATATVNIYAPSGFYTGGLIGYASSTGGSYVDIWHNTVNGEIICGSGCGGAIGYHELSRDDAESDPTFQFSDTSVTADISAGGSNVGGVIGYLYESSANTDFYNLSYVGDSIGVDITNMIALGDNVGGLIGGIENGETSTLLLETSFAKATILGNEPGFNTESPSGDNTGGLIGYTEVDTTITDSYFDGAAVNYNLNGGGLVGNSTDNVVISSSYTKGDFTGSPFGPAGGLVGLMNNGGIFDSFVTIPAGNADPEAPLGSVIGQLVGTLDSDSTVYVDFGTTQQQNCFGNYDNTDFDTDGHVVCNIVNLNDDQSHYFVGNSENVPLNNWDFADTWTVARHELPCLAWSRQSCPTDASDISLGDFTVLLVENGTDQNHDYLDENGVDYDTASTSEFADMSVETMKNYDVIIYEPGEDPVYDDLRTGLTNLETAMSQKHIVVSIRLAGNEGDAENVDPLGTDFVQSYGGYADFANPSSRFITGHDIGGVELQKNYFDNWNSTFHGWLNNPPTNQPGYDVILKNDHGPEWIEYNYEDSFVMVDTLTSINGGWGTGNSNVADNYIRYIAYRVHNSSSADNDSDGQPDYLEDTGPNHGDANGDGTLDSEQANVLSYINPVSHQWAVLETDCQSISNFQIGGESAETVDENYDYPFGLTSFHITCANPGDTATIRQYYYSVEGSDKYSVRKWMPDGSYREIPGYHDLGAPIDGDIVFLVQYQIKDGGTYDDDGSENAVIVDPSGAALSLGDGSSSGITLGNLAKTGESVLNIYRSSFWLLGASATAFLLKRKYNKVKSIYARKK